MNDFDTLLSSSLARHAESAAPIDLDVAAIEASGRRRRTAGRLAAGTAVVAAIGLLAAGSILGGASAPVNQATAPAPMATGTPNDEARPSSGLENYPGFRTIGAAKDQEAFARQNNAVEHLTGTCMQKKGFSYDTTGDAWTQYGKLNKANSRYVKSLSSQQRKAFFVALLNQEKPAAQGQTAVFANDPDGGCWPSSSAAVFFMERDFRPSSVYREYDEIKRTIKSDVAANAGWSQCMAEGGYAYTTVREFESGGVLPSYAAAVRSAECQAAFNAGTDRLRVRLEEEFLQKNRSTLDANLKLYLANQPLVDANQ